MPVEIMKSVRIKDPQDNEITVHYTVGSGFDLIKLGIENHEYIISRELIPDLIDVLSTVMMDTRNGNRTR